MIENCEAQISEIKAEIKDIKKKIKEFNKTGVAMLDAVKSASEEPEALKALKNEIEELKDKVGFYALCLSSLHEELLAPFNPSAYFAYSRLSDEDKIMVDYIPMVTRSIFEIKTNEADLACL